MTTKVHKTVQGDVPISTVYNQWTGQVAAATAARVPTGAAVLRSRRD